MPTLAQLQQRISYKKEGYGRWIVGYETEFTKANGYTNDSMAIDRISRTDLPERATCTNGYTLKQAYMALYNATR